MNYCVFAYEEWAEGLSLIQELLPYLWIPSLLHKHGHSHPAHASIHGYQGGAFSLRRGGSFLFPLKATGCHPVAALTCVLP